MAGLGKEYKAGEVVFRQGDKGNCMFVIQDGEVEAVVDSDGKELRLRTMGPNEFFGEMALLTGEKRTATVRASGSHLEVVEIDESSLRALLEHLLPMAQGGRGD